MAGSTDPCPKSLPLATTLDNGEFLKGFDGPEPDFILNYQTHGAENVELDQGLGTIHIDEGDETTLPSVNDDIVSLNNEEVPKGFDGPEQDFKVLNYQIPESVGTLQTLPSVKSIDKNSNQP